MTSCIHISRQVGFKAIFLFKMEGVKNLEIWRHRYINILSVSRDFLPASTCTCATSTMRSGKNDDAYHH
jgi:uncharacterized protein involved in response to NO